MGGFFGVASKRDCISDLFYGTDYHSHLGTKRGGMAVTTSDGKIYRTIHDITNAQFRSKFDSDLDHFAGRTGIGIISDFEDQPLIIASRHGIYSIVTVGKINNIEALAKEAFGCCIGAHFSEMSDGELNPTELVATLINRCDTIVEGIQYAQKVIDGSCSLLILLGDSIFAARDRLGRTPVIIGERDDAYAVTMETSAFPNLDFYYKYDLGPGEIVEITCDKVVQKKAPGSTYQICAFLWVYYGYPSSCYEGVNTEGVRYENGRLMAEDDDIEIDTVCGIPDSGVAHAIGYSNASGKPYQRAFVKYTPTWPRSFMPQNQQVRRLVAKMKLIPVPGQFEGKRLLFCEDSIVRGTQMRDTVVRIYERGAKEVHMRSASPPLIYGCKFLNFSRSRSELDLAARRAIEAIEGGPCDEETLKKYQVYGSEEYNKMVDYVRKELNLSSLKYQSLDKLIAAIGLPREQICTYCWTGEEPKDA